MNKCERCHEYADDGGAIDDRGFYLCLNCYEERNKEQDLQVNALIGITLDHAVSFNRERAERELQDWVASQDVYTGYTNDDKVDPELLEWADQYDQLQSEDEEEEEDYAA